MNVYEKASKYKKCSAYKLVYSVLELQVTSIGFYCILLF